MKVRPARSVLLLALAALAAGVVAWVAGSGDEALERVRETGVIRIGYAVEAPYARVGPDGRVTGASPELARLVAERMGIRRIEWVQTSFDALIVELQEGRFDLIAAGLFITPERAKAVSFAEPSLRVVSPALLVRAGNPRAIRSYTAAIANPQLRIAALAGSVEERGLQGRGLPPARLLSVPDANTGLQAVESGAADALALSLPTIRRMARDHPATLEAAALTEPGSADYPDSTFYAAFAFSRQHGGLLRAWNEAQAAIVGSPAHLETIAPFGFEAANLPGPMTLPKLLGQ